MKKKTKVVEPPPSPILDEYDKQAAGYEEFRKKLELLFTDILKHHSVRFHKVESRVKTRDSLKKKLAEKNKYEGMSDITDIVGFRIILFFQEDIDLVAEIMKVEFSQLEFYTNDKRIHSPNEFGYTSLHIVLQLSDERKSLLEYLVFQQQKFEVQIRTILQHSWAEIEHDIGYKARIDVPGDIRRSFARLAGLIELADEEFSRIRKTINSHEATNLNFPEVKADPLTLENLDKFVLNSTLLDLLAEKITQECKVQLIPDTGYYLGAAVLSRLLYLNYRYIFEVKDDLKTYKEKIIELAAISIGTGQKGLYLTKRVSLFYLCFLKVVADTNKDVWERYCREFNVPKKVKDRARLFYDTKYGEEDTG